jgi:hypothetical protein
MSVQFDLEQKILDCWGITDDLQDVLTEVLEGGLSKGEISNCLLGLVAIYEIKFAKCFSLFEQYIKEKHVA